MLRILQKVIDLEVDPRSDCDPVIIPLNITYMALYHQTLPAFFSWYTRLRLKFQSQGWRESSALASLAEDRGLVHRTHMAADHLSQSQFQGSQGPLLVSLMH